MPGTHWGEESVAARGQVRPGRPAISRASRQCFEAADAALSRSGAPAPIRQAVADFTERYVLQDRCPADDQLEESYDRA